jgi:hypothetical protein
MLMTIQVRPGNRHSLQKCGGYFFLNENNSLLLFSLLFSFFSLLKHGVMHKSMSISKHGVHNENVENTNGVTRIRESKNDKQYNEQKKATKTMNHKTLYSTL